jgi:hypothetical protein
MKPVFRHPDKFQLLPWREWLRNELPPGPKGWVAEDLDLVVRKYSLEDPVGRFMLIELKHGGASLSKSKLMTFGIIDFLLRQADPKRKIYRGYFLLQYPDPNPESCTHVIVNDEVLSLGELKQWLKFDFEIPPYAFEGVENLVIAKKLRKLTLGEGSIEEIKIEPLDQESAIEHLDRKTAAVLASKIRKR